MFQPCLSWETENPCKFFIYKGLSSSSCTQTRGHDSLHAYPDIRGGGQYPFQRLHPLHPSGYGEQVQYGNGVQENGFRTVQKMF